MDLLASVSLFYEDKTLLSMGRERDYTKEFLEKCTIKKCTFLNSKMSSYKKQEPKVVFY
jgi:hypothetical protein